MTYLMCCSAKAWVKWVELLWEAYTMKIIGKDIPSHFFPLLGDPKKLLLRIRMMEIFKPLCRAWEPQGSGMSIVRKVSTVVCTLALHRGDLGADLLLWSRSAYPCVGEPLGLSGPQFGNQGGKQQHWTMRKKMQTSIKFHCNKLPRSLRERKCYCETVFHQSKLIILVSASLGRRSVSVIQNSSVRYQL